MALDGMFLSFLKKELQSQSIGSRVEKIYQPSREELVLVLRGKNGSNKFLLSARANSPRVQFTKYSPENPSTPPMLCMLLRKLLSGARLVDIRQPDLERILFFDFDATNEMGDHVKLTLCIEIMARHSNIILIDENLKILDSVKRIDVSMSSVRQVLPGMFYELPPAQDKLSLLNAEIDEVIAKLRTSNDMLLSKALQQNLQGISPLVSREIAQKVCHGIEKRLLELSDDNWQLLAFSLKNLKATLLDDFAQPTLVLDKTSKPMEYSFMEISQYGTKGITKKIDSYSVLLDEFYAERDRIERTKQRSHDLLKTLSNKVDRITKKVNIQSQELLECENKDRFKEYGDIINANLYSLEKGVTFYELVNFYDENKIIKINVDPSLTPSQNAQKYYKEYRKATTAEKKLVDLIKSGKEELEYLDTVFDELSRADTENELTAIKEELIDQGYIRAAKTKGKKQKPVSLKPIKYLSVDGYEILVGRNNIQNDKLTLHQASKTDYWFHVKDVPGSHVIVVANNETPPDTTLTQAVLLSAFYSKARESVLVAVDYTQVKNVKKIAKAKPGMVTYDNYTTAFITPDKEMINEISKTN